MDTMISVALLGASKSGKTALATNLKENVFYEDYEPTIGTILVKTEQTFHDKKFLFTLHDSSGNKKFQAVMEPHLKSADAYLFVCDLTDEKGLENLDAIIETIPSHSELEKKQFILVGTKADLTKERKITPAAFEKKATALNFHCVEVSSKTGDGVIALFEHIANEFTKEPLHKKIEDNFVVIPPQPKATIKNNEPSFLKKHYGKILLTSTLFAILSLAIVLSTNISATFAAYLLQKFTLPVNFAAPLADSLLVFTGLITGTALGAFVGKIVDIFTAKKNAAPAVTPTTKTPPPQNTKDTPTNTKNILARIIERKPPITEPKIPTVEELVLPSAEDVYSSVGDDKDVIELLSDSEESSRKAKRGSIYG